MKRCSIPYTWHSSSRLGGGYRQNRCNLEEGSPRPHPHTLHVAMTNTGHTKARSAGKGGEKRGERREEGGEWELVG